MSKPTSLLVVLTPDEEQEFLPEPLGGQVQTLLPQVRFLDPTPLDAAGFARELAATNPDILLGCWKTPPLPTALPARLRYVCYLTGSLKKLLSRRHIERGLIVTNWGGSIARTVAEAAVFHVLTCLRNGSHWALTMHQPGVAAWKNGGNDARSLFCRRVGIHGFGPVARELVALLEPWQCRIRVYAPDATPEVARAHDVEIAPSLEALFSDNEIVVELAPLIPETQAIVNERLLRSIPEGGVFVNVGRGAVVDEEALLRVAREGRIAVGLDVFAHEPLPADSGFRSLPRVSLTPHIAGPTIDRFPDAGAFALRNLRAFVAGEPLEAVVTPAVYDRST